MPHLTTHSTSFPFFLFGWFVVVVVCCFQISQVMSKLQVNSDHLFLQYEYCAWSMKTIIISSFQMFRSIIMARNKTIINKNIRNHFSRVHYVCVYVCLVIVLQMEQMEIGDEHFVLNMFIVYVN